MLDQLLNDKDLSFAERSERVATIIGQDEDIQRLICELLKNRFRLEQQRTSNSLSIQGYEHGRYRSILPLPEDLLGSPAIIKHSMQAFDSWQTTMSEDTINEYAAYNLFDRLGFDTPAYLVELVHPSFRQVLNLQESEEPPYFSQIGSILPMYDLVVASQLLPDLSEGGRYRVVEVDDMGNRWAKVGKWFEDDRYTQKLLDHFDQVEKKLSKFEMTLKRKKLSGESENLRLEYFNHASSTFALLEENGEIGKLVFGDMQNFYEYVVGGIRANIPEAINFLSQKTGYEGPSAPKVNLDAALFIP